MTSQYSTAVADPFNTRPGRSDRFEARRNARREALEPVRKPPPPATGRLKLVAVVDGKTVATAIEMAA